MLFEFVEVFCLKKVSVIVRFTLPYPAALFARCEGLIKLWDPKTLGKIALLLMKASLDLDFDCHREGDLLFEC
jgi:hypothetical protein